MTKDFYVEPGKTAFLTIDKRIGEFLRVAGPIFNPDDPYKLWEDFGSDRKMQNNLHAAWPQIQSAAFAEEVDTANPDFAVGIGKIVVSVTEDSEEHGWMATLFGPTQARPDVTPGRPMGPDAYIAEKSRQGYSQKENEAVIKNPAAVLTEMLPGDNTLRQRYGAWAVTAKNAFVEQNTADLEKLTYSPDSDELIAGNIVRMADLYARRDWMPYFAESDSIRLSGADGLKNRNAIVNAMLAEANLTKESITEEQYLNLGNMLLTVGSEQLFRNRISEADLLQGWAEDKRGGELEEDRQKAFEKLDTSGEALSEVDNFIQTSPLGMGIGTEIPDYARNEMATELLGAYNQANIAGEPTPDISSVLSGFDPYIQNWITEKQRRTTLEKFDTDTEATAAVTQFMSKYFGIGTEIPDYAKNAMAARLLDSYTMADATGGPIPDDQDVLWGFTPYINNWIERQRTDPEQVARGILGITDFSKMALDKEVTDRLEASVGMLSEGIKAGLEADPFSGKLAGDVGAGFMQSIGLTPMGELAPLPGVTGMTTFAPSRVPSPDVLLQRKELQRKEQELEAPLYHVPRPGEPGEFGDLSFYDEGGIPPAISTLPSMEEQGRPKDLYASVVEQPAPFGDYPPAVQALAGFDPVEALRQQYDPSRPPTPPAGYFGAGEGLEPIGGRGFIPARDYGQELAPALQMLFDEGTPEFQNFMAYQPEFGAPSLIARLIEEFRKSQQISMEDTGTVMGAVAAEKAAVERAAAKRAKEGLPPLPAGPTRYGAASAAWGDLRRAQLPTMEKFVEGRLPGIRTEYEASPFYGQEQTRLTQEREYEEAIAEREASIAESTRRGELRGGQSIFRRRMA
jgi:hypothetical protein